MILVADDNDELRAALVDHLRRRGHEVIEAADGERARELLRSRRQELEVLITDFEMPGLDGLSLIREARRLRPGVRSLLITSRLPADPPAVSPPIEALLKPFELSRITAWLEGRSAPETDGSLTLLGPSGDSVPPRRAAVALAASVVLALLLVLGLLGRGFGASGGDSLLPDPPADDPVRSLAVDGLQPLGVMAEPPEAFRWRPVAGAVHYRIRITDLDGRPIWEEEGDGPEVVVPPRIRGDWAPFVAFYVSVEALGAEGATLASVSGGRVRVVPPSDPSPAIPEPSS